MADQTPEKLDAAAPAPVSDVAAAASDDQKPDQASAEEAKPEGELRPPFSGARCNACRSTGTVSVGRTRLYTAIQYNALALRKPMANAETHQ